MTEKFKCQIRNHTDKTITLKSPKNYIHRNFFIKGHTKLTVAFDDEAFFLSAYERIVYKKSGKIDCIKRKNFRRDLEFPTCKFLNLGGSFFEVMVIAPYDSLILPKGIEIVRHVPFYSFYSDFESVTIAEPKTVAVPVLMSPGEIKMEERQNIIYTKRPEKDLKKIKQMREQSYLRSVGLGSAGE